MANLNIKLVRSIIGTLPKQRKTVQALGLSKVAQIVEKPDNAQVRGMIERVKHLVEIVEA